jgi:hypothetical protein
MSWWDGFNTRRQIVERQKRILKQQDDLERKLIHVLDHERRRTEQEKP